MLTLINTNRMRPPIAPVGLDYVAGAAREAGIDVDLLDLCLAERHEAALLDYFAGSRPELVGLSFRNASDCFWPSAASFVPDLLTLVKSIRSMTDAPIVLGGVGYSMFAEEIIRLLDGEVFGIRGDGEEAIVQLVSELRGERNWRRVPGLVWSENGAVRSNRPAWPEKLNVPWRRDIVDNAAYFRLGGQIGVETKRGCDRRCAYCADRLAKGPVVRLRDPADVANEVASLLSQSIDVLHLCDAEFNIAPRHALDVCDELIRRGLNRRVKWYAYMAVVPFDSRLANRMAQAGCVGINFTSDSANASMLTAYRQRHNKEDLAAAVRLCRENGMAVMLDLLLGGPGETPETLAESLKFFMQLNPDCCGASLGVQLYPNTEMTAVVAAEGPMETNGGIRRHYSGPIDLLCPTFYISPALGKNPARLIRELIAGDSRFFPPEEEAVSSCGPVEASGDHNYNQNSALCDAIAAGARGAYWDILRKMRR
jgi:tryptophan 2-C-methyltransferase